MTTDLALVLLAAAIVIFIVNRPRMDAVALIMIVALPFTGVITVNEALAGFADPAVVPIAALFVIGEGLARTGVPGAPGTAPRRAAGPALPTGSSSTRCRTATTVCAWPRRRRWPGGKSAPSACASRS